jgi:hypothetical protein
MAVGWEEEMSEKCQRRVFSGRRDDMRGHSCGKPAKVQESGFWLCSLHTAQGEKTRREKLHARWDADYAAQKALVEAKQEDLRRARVFPALVEALSIIARHADEHISAIAKDAIAKAEGK